ncbi:Uncharacterised protein [Mycobacteroides abscessus subsp. abscessus]|nr:Uncharacterised protein [Mycobacteroides abscessus subsp. abscessus]
MQSNRNGRGTALKLTVGEGPPRVCHDHRRTIRRRNRVSTREHALHQKIVATVSFEALDI